jgi:hypothetical protein
MYPMSRVQSRTGVTVTVTWRRTQRLQLEGVHNSVERGTGGTSQWAATVAKLSLVSSYVAGPSQRLRLRISLSVLGG